MFVSDDNSQNYTSIENNMDFVYEEIINYEEVKTEDVNPELELMDDQNLCDLPVLATLVGLGAENLLAGVLTKNCVLLFAKNFSFLMAITPVH